MTILFDDGDLEELMEVFADEFHFSGPFYEFGSARAYVDALKAGPFRDYSYEIIGEFENGDSACVVFRFIKPGISVIMSEYFGVTNGKIGKILLVFDTAPFVQSVS